MKHNFQIHVMGNPKTGEIEIAKTPNEHQALTQRGFFNVREHKNKLPKTREFRARLRNAQNVADSIKERRGSIAPKSVKTQNKGFSPFLILGGAAIAIALLANK